MLAASFPVFDYYRKKFLVGELLWNFADFETAQCIYNDYNVLFLLTYYLIIPATGRVDGNKKGVLTRQRQPKLGAWVVRERYWTLFKGLDYCHNKSFFYGFNSKYC